MSDYSINSTITADDSGYVDAINNIISGLNNFSNAFSSMNDSTKDSFTDLANQFQAIDGQAKIWGDDSDVISEKMNALKNEINNLIDQGIDPESAHIQDLKSAYDSLGTQQEVFDEKNKQTGNAIIDGLSEWGINIDKLYEKGSSFFNEWGINIDQLANKLGTTGPLLTGMVGVGIVLGELGKKLEDYINDVAKAANEIDRMSQMTGLSTDFLQQMKYAIEQTDGNFSAITTSIRYMTQNLEKHKEAFDSLGISINNADGTLRNAGDIFNDTILKLSDMQDHTERNQLAFELFGRQAQGLIPTMNAGSEAISQLEQKASDLGIVMNESLIKQSNDWIHNLETLHEASDALGHGLVEVLLPSMNSVISIVSETIIWYRTGIQVLEEWKEKNDISNVIAGWKNGKTSVYDYYTALQEAIAMNEKAISSDKLSTAEKNNISIATHNYQLALSDLVFQHGNEIQAKKEVIQKEQEDALAKQATSDAQKRQNDINTDRNKVEDAYKLSLQDIDTQLKYGMISEDEASKQKTDAQKKEIDGLLEVVSKYQISSGITVDLIKNEIINYDDKNTKIVSSNEKKDQDILEQQNASNANLLEAQKTLNDGLSAYDAQFLLDKKSIAQDWLNTNKDNTDAEQSSYYESLSDMDASHVASLTKAEQDIYDYARYNKEFNNNIFQMSDGTWKDIVISVESALDKIASDNKITVKQLETDFNDTITGIISIVGNLTEGLDSVSQASIKAGTDFVSGFLKSAESGFSFSSVLGLIVTGINDIINATQARQKAQEVADKKAMDDAQKIMDLQDSWDYKLKQQTASKLELIQMEMDKDTLAAEQAGANAKTIYDIKTYYDKLLLDEENTEYQAAIDQRNTELEATQQAYQTQIQPLVDIIGNGITQGIDNGLDSNDITKAITDKLKTAIINAAVMTQSFSSEIESLAAQVNTAMARGITSSDITVFQTEMDLITQKATDTANTISKIFNNSSSLANLDINSISQDTLSGLQSLYSMLNPTVGGQSGATIISNLVGAGYASGTDYSEEGVRKVGEYGPEYVHLKQGSQVSRENETIGSRSSGMGSKTVTFAPVFNSPKAMNQYEQMSALKQTLQDAAFDGVLS